MLGVRPQKSIIVRQPLVQQIPNDVRMDDDQLIYGIQISLLNKRIDGQNHLDDDITSLRNLHACLDSEELKIDVASLIALLYEYRAAGLSQSNLPQRSDRSDEQWAWYQNNVPQGITLEGGWVELALSSAEPIYQLFQVFKHELAGKSILHALHEEITEQNAESHYRYYLHFPDQLTARTLCRIYSFLEATVPDADKRLVNALFSEYKKAKDANSENTEWLDLLLVKLFQALPDQIQSRVTVIEGLSDHINLRLNPEKQKAQKSYPPIQRPNASALNKSPQVSVSARYDLGIQLLEKGDINAACAQFEGLAFSGEEPSAKQAYADYLLYALFPLHTARSAQKLERSCQSYRPFASPKWEELILKDLAATPKMIEIICKYAEGNKIIKKMIDHHLIGITAENYNRFVSLSNGMPHPHPFLEYLLCFHDNKRMDIVLERWKTLLASQNDSQAKKELWIKFFTFLGLAATHSVPRAYDNLVIYLDSRIPFDVDFISHEGVINAIWMIINKYPKAVLASKYWTVLAGLQKTGPVQYRLACDNLKKAAPELFLFLFRKNYQRSEQTGLPVTWMLDELADFYLESNRVNNDTVKQDNQVRLDLHHILAKRPDNKLSEKAAYCLLHYIAGAPQNKDAPAIAITTRRWIDALPRRSSTLEEAALAFALTLERIRGMRNQAIIASDNIAVIAYYADLSIIDNTFPTAPITRMLLKMYPATLPPDEWRPYVKKEENLEPIASVLYQKMLDEKPFYKLW